MEFSRPEDWSRLPRTPPGDLPNPAIELGPPAFQVDSLPAEPPGKPNSEVLLRDTSLLQAAEGQGGWIVTREFWELHVEKEWGGLW